MSDITGEGYGDKHSWKRLTNNIGSSHIEDYANTLYGCEKCNELFIHLYNIIPDIFQAMKENNINEECEIKI
jgi:hypothetical protein